MKRTLLILLLLACATPLRAQKPDSPECQYWIAYATPLPTPKKRIGKKDDLPPKVFPSTVAEYFDNDDPWQFAALTDAQRMQAIACLLTEQNDQRKAAFGPATRLDISQLFDTPHANLAALYVISYLYTGTYHHAGAVALRGEDARSTEDPNLYITTDEATHRAYAAYRTWFSKIQQQGLAAARAANLQPLDGSGLYWYKR